MANVTAEANVEYQTEPGSNKLQRRTDLSQTPDDVYDFEGPLASSKSHGGVKHIGTKLFGPVPCLYTRGSHRAHDVAAQNPETWRPCCRACCVSGKGYFDPPKIKGRLRETEYVPPRQPEGALE